MDGAEGGFRERKRQRAALCHLFGWCYLLSVAEAAARQAAQLPPLSQRAREAPKMGRFKEAQEAYEESIKQNSRSPEAYSNLGLALYMQGHYPGAITDLQRALEFDHDLRNTVVLLALSYFSLNEFGKTVPLLEKAYTEYKDDPVVAQHLGLAYLKVHEDEKTLAALSRWVELEPNNPDAVYYKDKAASYVSLNAFEKLEEIGPDSCRMHELQAELFAQQGQTDAAVGEYQKALVARPQLPGLHFALGTLYWENNRHAEARAEFEQELQISPYDAPTHYLLGEVLLQQNELAGAAIHLSRALELQPGLINAQLDMAKLYRSQGETTDAIETLQGVVRADGDRPEPHFMLYELYENAKDLDRAKAELATFQRLKTLASEKERKSKGANVLR